METVQTGCLPYGAHHSLYYLEGRIKGRSYIEEWDTTWIAAIIPGGKITVQPLIFMRWSWLAKLKVNANWGCTTLWLAKIKGRGH